MSCIQVTLPAAELSNLDRVVECGRLAHESLYPFPGLQLNRADGERRRHCCDETAELVFGHRPDLQRNPATVALDIAQEAWFPGRGVREHEQAVVPRGAARLHQARPALGELMVQRLTCQMRADDRNGNASWDERGRDVRFRFPEEPCGELHERRVRK